MRLEDGWVPSNDGGVFLNRVMSMDFVVVDLIPR